MKGKFKKILISLLSVVMLFGMAIPLQGCTVKGDPNAIRIIAHTEMQEWLDPLMQKFTDETGLKMEALYGINQIDELETELPPDLLFFGNTAFSSMAHHCEDLNVLLENELGGNQAKIDEFNNGFLDGVREYGAYEDRQIFWPSGINVSMLYYNKGIFDKEKLAYPQADWTHEDFITAGKALTKKEGNNYTQWGASTTAGWWGEYLIYARQYGSDFYLADGKTPAMDTPAFKQGIEFFKRKAVGADKMAPNPGSTTVGEGDLNGFMGRATAMEFGGHTGNWAGYNTVKNFEWDVEMLPTPVGKADARGGEIAVEGWSIAKKGLNKEGALKFLMWLFTDEGVDAFTTDSGRIMPSKHYKETVLAVPKDERPQPQNMEAVFAAIDKAMPLPTNPHFEGSAKAPVYNQIALYLNGGITSIDEFGSRAVSEVNKYVKTQQ